MNEKLHLLFTKITEQSFQQFGWVLDFMRSVVGPCTERLRMILEAENDTYKSDMPMNTWLKTMSLSNSQVKNIMS